MSEAGPLVDLSAYLSAVPDEVVERLRAARRVLTVCHENPEADALGRRPGDRAPRGVESGSGHARMRGPGAAGVLNFMPGMDDPAASRMGRSTTTFSWWSTAASWNGSGRC